MIEGGRIGQGAAWLKEANAATADLWNEFEGWAGSLPPSDSPAYADQRRAFMVGASMMRRRAMAQVLMNIAKRRALDRHESDLLERILNRERHKRKRWNWTKQEDEKIRALMRRQRARGKPRPYTKSPAVARLAKQLGRSYLAIHKRMKRLRDLDQKRADRAPKPASNCPNAGTEPTG
jgi:hypothetical protein